MYKCKIFEGSINETELNTFLNQLPESANIISINYIPIPNGSFYNGNGHINAETKILVVWKE